MAKREFDDRTPRAPARRKYTRPTMVKSVVLAEVTARVMSQDPG